MHVPGGGRRRHAAGGGAVVRAAVSCLALLVLLAGACRAVPAVHTESPMPPGRIAFVRDGNLWLWEGGGERQLTRGGGASWPRFSADGRYLAYRYDRALWVLDLKGGGPWRVPGVSGGEWAPFGPALTGRSDQGVVVVTVTERGPLPARLVAPGAGGAAWSPDGRLLTVVRGERGPQQLAGRTTLAVVPPEGGPLKVILTEPFPRQAACGPVGGAAHPHWSADGRWLAFYRTGMTASLAADCNELAAVPAAGGRAVALGVGPANPNWFAWSPDGAAVAFTAGHGRYAWHDKTLRVAEMPPRPPYRAMTPPGYADRDPAWAPDGHRLAFTRSRTETPRRMDLPAAEQAVWVADLRTGASRPVPGSEEGISPRWGRDGSLLWVSAHLAGDRRRGILHWTPAPGQGPVSVAETDQAVSYYGQWYWRAVFDWWSLPVPNPVQ